MPIDSFDAEIVVTSDRGDERSMEISTGIGGVRLCLSAGPQAVDALMSPVSARALALALNMAATYQEAHYEQPDHWMSCPGCGADYPCGDTTCTPPFIRVCNSCRLNAPCCRCSDPRPYDPRCACLECGCAEMNYPSCECNSPRVPGHRCDE